MTGQRLYKIEKLRSEIAIGQLFDRSNPAAQSVMAYPLRAVWSINPARCSALPPDDYETLLSALGHLLPGVTADGQVSVDGVASGVTPALSDLNPLAVVRNPQRKVATCPQFLVAVPKKKLRHAVDRVQMRRRIREAYRLNRHLIPMDLPIDIAFVYVASEVLPYSDVLKGVTRILTRIARALTTPSFPEQSLPEAVATTL